MPATLSATPDDLWFKDAIIYEIHIKAFQDSNADGIGDFQGLIDRLDYLQHLGVTTIWLLPFYPSPQRDGGYDISDYFSINPDYGTLKQFKRLMKEAHKRGLKVITELVINHTSDQHPWFQRARKAKPGSRYRDWYVWNDSPEKYQDVRIIFQDFETSNWSWDSVAGAYYWHRFYSHQPDLNFDNEEVQQEIFKILDFWIDMGVDGFRLDAIPYLFERENTNCENLPETHQFLKKLRKHAESKKSDVMLLAEANMWPEDSAEYFGDGDECHMNYHFPIMPRMFMALKMEDRYPIIDIIDQTPDIPANCQWGMFLRNHDELTLEMVTDEERDYMYQAYNKDALSRVNLGIRHRLAPLLDNDRHKIELMNCLLFSMPGTPVIYYGDEIGMGDNVYLGDRDGVRTPMQWSPDRNASFSTAHPHKLFLPLINDPEYHYETVNVETQQNNGSSLYWWMKRTIAIRKRFKAFGRGDIKFLTPENAKVLAFTRSYKDEHLLILANLSRHPQAAELSLPEYEGYSPREIFGQTPFPTIEAGLNRFTLGAYGYYWFALEPKESHQSHSLPTLKRPGVKWTKIFRGQYRQEIEEAILPKFLRNNSRYIVDGRVLESVSIENDQKIAFGEENFILLVLKATFTEGFPERFFLPLAIQEDGELPTSLSPVFQFQAEGEQRTVFDACDLPSFQKCLLHILLGQQKSNGKPFHVQRIRGIQSYRTLEDLPAPRIAKLQNSNLCLIFDDKYFLKIFHRLGQTTNPDLEINRIAEKKSLPVPGYLAHLEVDKEEHAGLVLAMLQPYIPNQGTAKQYFHDAADRYLDRIQPQGERPELADFPWGMEAAELPAVWESILGNMPLQRAALLGRELAELHANLTTHPQADFQPEAFSLHYQRSLFAAFQPLIRTVFKQLAQNREMPGVDALIGSKSTITEKLKQIYDHKLEAQKVRLHGDLHLEKVLFTGREFCFFDFEGDRQRDYRKLRLRKSPAHELASLICSFYYAALDAICQRAGEKSILEHPMLPWMEAWFAAMSRALLKGYLSIEPARKLLPEDDTDRHLLLHTFMLERHLYELSFELNAQRDLSEIPLRGILRILDIERQAAAEII